MSVSMSAHAQAMQARQAEWQRWTRTIVKQSLARGWFVSRGVPWPDGASWWSCLCWPWPKEPPSLLLSTRQRFAWRNQRLPVRRRARAAGTSGRIRAPSCSVHGKRGGSTASKRTQADEPRRGISRSQPVKVVAAGCEIGRGEACVTRTRGPSSALCSAGRLQTRHA